jgi:hypothetical protein
MTTTSNRFCLLMIVRDEEVIIKRCLDSIKDIFDTYIICDTGSKDDTVGKIKEFMDTNNKIGEVIYREWKNFGENKTYLLKYFKHESKVSDAKYIMWLDADEVFITDKNNPTSYLTKEDVENLYNTLERSRDNIYMFPTLYCGLEYDRWQIARNNQDYRWDYPVQELFVGCTENSTSYLKNFYNFSRKEGNSSRTSRGEADIKMLEDYLKDHPDDSRCVFYLGQAHSNIDNAIENYKKRLNLGGYSEEKYISCLRLGRLSKNDNDKVYYWLQAIDISPNRLESIHELMMLYHNKKDFKKACLYGKLASDNRTNNKFLFQEKDIYDYLFDFYFALSLHFNGEHNMACIVGQKTIDRIHLCPPHIANQAKTNLFYYNKSKNETLSTSITSLTNKPSNQLVQNNNNQVMTQFQHKNIVPVVLLIDNFYEDPDKVRKFALAQDFNVKGNYPGGRTKSFATIDDKIKFENILGRKITYFPGEYNGSFQIVTGTNTSWIHRDKTDFSVVVFLTPNPPPNGGTILYKHKQSGLERTSNQDEEKILNDDSYNEDNWHRMDRLGNKYNRAIMFQGRTSHKSDEYFGNDMETGRLFQTFFFDIEK